MGWTTQDSLQAIVPPPEEEIRRRGGWSRLRLPNLLLRIIGIIENIGKFLS